MSVNFYPEILEGDPEPRYALFCDKTERRITDETFTYSEGRIEAGVHGLTCDDDMCISYGADMRPVDAPPSVNVNNANAYWLLTQLGLNEHAAQGGECPGPFASGEAADVLSGSHDPADFIARVHLALGLGGHDVGEVGHVQRGEGATVYFCGRPEGYGDRTLPHLLEVAEYCQEHGREVCWA